MEPSPAPSRRKSFAEVCKDFLNTPGYSTSQVTKHGSHEAYMETFKTKETRMKEAEKDETQQEMDVFATQITKLLKETTETFMLGEPLTPGIVLGFPLVLIAIAATGLFALLRSRRGERF